MSKLSAATDLFISVEKLEQFVKGLNAAILHEGDEENIKHLVQAIELAMKDATEELQELKTELGVLGSFKKVASLAKVRSKKGGAK